jgi:polar amino acid transport system substrate-binding protein
MRQPSWLLGLSLLGLLAAPLTSADSPTTVGVAFFPPNVMQGEAGEGFYTGFDIELWEEIGRRADIESEFKLLPFEQLLVAVKEGEVDAAIAGITINGPREREMDFSHPYMNSGVRILAALDSNEPAMLRLLRGLPESGVIRPISYLLGFMLICSHILFFAERGSSSISRGYFPGIFEAAWCILATMTTVGYGDITPQRWVGRFVAFLVMITGIALFGIIIAQLSAGLTLAELGSDINGPDDLRDRRVATVAGSTSADLVRGYGARLVEVGEIESAYGLLEAGNVDAVVFDAPPLFQYVKERGEDQFALVGPLLHSESYGVAFPNGSPLREEVSRTILELQEDGTYDELYEKWFGETP